MISEVPSNLNGSMILNENKLVFIPRADMDLKGLFQMSIIGK